MECALRSGIQVYLRSGVGVALECDAEWHWSASQICKLTLHYHSGVVMEW